MINSESSESFFVPDDLQLSKRQRKNSEALAHFAYALFQQMKAGNRSEQAHDHFRKAVENSPYSENLVTQAFGRLLLRNKYDEVIQALLPLFEQYPDSVPITRLLVDSYRATDRPRMAITLLEEAFFTEQVRKAFIVRQLTALYWEQKQFDRIDEMLKIARKSPELKDSFATYYSLAVYHAAISEGEDGNELSDKKREKHAAKSGKYGSKAISYLGQVEDKAQFRTLSEVLANTEQFDPAIRVIDRALKKFGNDNPELILQKADLLHRNNNANAGLKTLNMLDIEQHDSPGILLGAGKIYARLGEYDNAMAAFSRLLKKNPQASGLRRTMAVIMLRQAKPAKAVNLLQEADSLTPSGQFLLSRALYQDDNKQDALKTLNSALTQARQNDNKKFITNGVKLYQASLNEACGNIDKALAIAEKVYNDDPDNARHANFYGYLLADQDRQLDKAKRLIEKALSIAGDEAAYLDSLAWVQFRRQNYQKALELIISAMRRMKHLHDPVIYEHAGDIYAAADYPLTAVSYWQKAITQGAEKSRILRKKIDEACNKSMSSEYKVPEYPTKTGRTRK